MGDFLLEYRYLHSRARWQSQQIRPSFHEFAYECFCIIKFRYCRVAVSLLQSQCNSGECNECVRICETLCAKIKQSRNTSNMPLFLNIHHYQGVLGISLLNMNYFEPTILAWCLFFAGWVKEQNRRFLGPALQGKNQNFTNKQYFCHKIAFKELSQSFPKRYDSPLYVKN